MIYGKKGYIKKITDVKFIDVSLQRIYIIFFVLNALFPAIYYLTGGKMMGVEEALNQKFLLFKVYSEITSILTYCIYYGFFIYVYNTDKKYQIVAKIGIAMVLISFVNSIVYDIFKFNLIPLMGFAYAFIIMFIVLTILLKRNKLIPFTFLNIIIFGFCSTCNYYVMTPRIFIFLIVEIYFFIIDAYPKCPNCKKLFACNMTSTIYIGQSVENRDVRRFAYHDNLTNTDVFKDATYQSTYNNYSKVYTCRRCHHEFEQGVKKELIKFDVK